MEHNALRIRTIFGKHAERYRDKYRDVSMYAGSLGFFLDGLPNGANVLELGCGPGNVTSFLLDRRPDLHILATDFAPEMVEVAKKEVASAKMMVLDATKMANLVQTFDGIVAGFILPYLTKSEMKQLFADASRKLIGNGRLYVSSMVETDTQKSGIRTSSHGEEIYMQYHALSDIIRELNASGFIILFQNTESYPAVDGSKTTDVMIVAEKTR